MKTQLHRFRPGWCAFHYLAIWGVFYGLTCLTGVWATGWNVWAEYPWVMFTVPAFLILLPRPLTWLLIRSGVLRKGFYCSVSQRRAWIHLAPWTPLKALNSPQGGKLTRESLLHALRHATGLINNGDVSEIIMASRMLSPSRINRTLRQAGINNEAYQIIIFSWQEGRLSWLLLQTVLLLTRWSMPANNKEGYAVLIRRKNQF